ncbi:WD repeat-containing protein 19 [Blyttiomyces sp. JEL0837]|nr:WD repeat-containing protein 19 [Blyttiomyces sp. JEL0837]
MGWTPDGEFLVAVVDTSPLLFIWSASQRKSLPTVDTNMKGLSHLAWNHSGVVLAVGTLKGNLLLYNRNTSKKIPVLGKHSKAIVCAAWSKDDVLACGSLDNTFTLTNLEGDTIFQMSVKGEPSKMQWSTMAKQNDASTTPVLSMILSNKTLFFHSLASPESPIELAFQQKYGNIINYGWFGEGFVMIGFSTGYFVVVSTNMNEIGQELFQAKNHKDSLNDLAISSILGKVATCGDGTVKVHELSDLKDVYAILNLEEDRGGLLGLEWTDDGGFLSVGTKSGNIFTFLSKLPVIGASSGPIVSYVTALREITIVDHSKENLAQFTYKTDVDFEPSVVGIGPTEYLASISAVSISGTVAAVLLTDGRLQVHSLDCPGTSQPPYQKIFPDKDLMHDGEPVQITCVSVTNDLLVYGTSNGLIHHFSTEDWALVNELTHKVGIVSIVPQPRRSRLIFKDEMNDIYFYDPVKGLIFLIPNISTKTLGVLWETTQSQDRSIFMSWDDSFLTTHSFQPMSVKGPQCMSLGTTKLPHGLKPLLFNEGAVICQTPGGKLLPVNLSTHELLNPQALLQETELVQGKALQLAYTLGNYKDLWSVVDAIASRKAWTMAAEAALHSLDLQTAKRIYRQVLHNAGMVTTLSDIEATEDRLVLAGHVAVIFGDFDHAQDLFLQSSEPICALEMRRDLMQWEQALSLAKKLSPDDMTIIAREYATRLESEGKFAEALAMYERALETSTRHPGPESAKEDHQIQCSSGITRMTFRMGDISRGMKMLNGVEEFKLLGDCATILEGIKMYTESGGLFERAQMWEKAADVFIKGKMWNKVGAILDKVTSPRIFLQYAKAKEASQQYAEAALAYERGKDYENLVRLYVEHLHNIDGAVKIVRDTRSKESARVVSKFFQGMKDFKSVVEFLLMAGMADEAFELAQQHDVMDHFGELVKNDATPEMRTSFYYDLFGGLLNLTRNAVANIGSYFENKNQLFSAGQYHLRAKNYAKALRMFTRAPVLDGKSIEMAIEAVGLAKSDALTHELIDYLMGETDGVPKDAKYIFKLYMSLGSYKDAARTAIIIAREEQTLGRSPSQALAFAHHLKKCKAKVPADLERMLSLLHSYILVKTLVRINEHEQGARMLIRVAHNISKFPSHVVPILTSTVIECQRAGLKKEAFEYAAMLMRPEYRNLVDPKYKRKIEQIVRHPDKDQGTVEEKMSSCPYDSNMLPETSLDCSECKNHLPYCIATGKHMTLKEWSQCPNCEFPALFNDFKTLVAKTSQCPMCGVALKEEDVKLSINPEELLRGATESREAPTPYTSKPEDKGVGGESSKKEGGAGSVLNATGSKPADQPVAVAQNLGKPALRSSGAPNMPDMDVPFGAVTEDSGTLKAAAPAAGIATTKP